MIQACYPAHAVSPVFWRRFINDSLLAATGLYCWWFWRRVHWPRRPRTRRLNRRGWGWLREPPCPPSPANRVSSASFPRRDRRDQGRPVGSPPRVRASRKATPADCPYSMITTVSNTAADPRTNRVQGRGSAVAFQADCPRVDDNPAGGGRAFWRGWAQQATAYPRENNNPVSSEQRNSPVRGYNYLW